MWLRLTHALPPWIHHPTFRDLSFPGCETTVEMHTPTAGGPMEPPRPHGNSGKLGAASSLGRVMALTVCSKCSALCPAGFTSAPWITQCCSEEAESQAPSHRLGCLPCKPGEPGTSLFIYSSASVYICGPGCAFRQWENQDPK